jgi:subtilase family serine protease
MKKNASPFSALLALIYATMLLLFTIPGQAQSQQLLTRHVRDEVANGRAQLVGQLPATQTLRFDIVSATARPRRLAKFVQEVQDPTSPSYHQFLTPQEFTCGSVPARKIGTPWLPSRKRAAFRSSAETEGRDLRLTGTVANIEKAFHVTLGLYKDPTEDRTFFAVDREPTVELPFQLWHITGLDNDSRPHPLYVKKTDYAKAHGIDPDKVVNHATTGSGPSASFLGSDMRAAYYGGTALTGSGQTIGLFEFLGTDLADLNTYYKNVGQTEPYTPTLISTGGYSTSCTASSGCDDTEQTLDMTQAMGMAPGSTMLYMYVCGNASSISDTACISAMVSTAAAPLSKQISCSWGWTPADPSTLDPYFEQMASQGQNFFAAAGDSSAWSASNEAWPADDANIVSVGGTDLTTSSAAGPWKSETAWADSGGGISPDSIPIPSWQQLSGVITSPTADPQPCGMAQT